MVTFPVSRRYWPPVGQSAQAVSRRQGARGERHTGGYSGIQGDTGGSGIGIQGSLVSARDAGFPDRNLPASLPLRLLRLSHLACMVCHVCPTRTRGGVMTFFENGISGHLRSGIFFRTQLWILYIPNNLYVPD